MLRRARPWLIPLVLLFAGCVGAEKEDPALNETTQPEAALPAEAAPDVVVPEANASLRPATLPFAYDGTWSPSLCVPVDLGRCAMPVGFASEGSWTVLDRLDEVSHVTATLTWTPSSPLTQEMFVRLIAHVPGCQQDCEYRTLFSGEGASPLVAESADPQLAPDERIGVMIRPVSLFPEPLYGWGNAEQPFRVEGAMQGLTR